MSAPSRKDPMNTLPLVDPDTTTGRAADLLAAV
jgi:hypothetical protein